ncbi:hypothetical protein GIB67_030863 [Kingdonia uniflora]|uniref:Uncharacterized protein n=1 Tax=Kingdonia uniflora TaxID=39325 RepID=A0A7J7L3E8_9MAGN|nr:hypothetical protein GIB67_030863 [Kingdonia uniflora]
MIASSVSSISTTRKSGGLSKFSGLKLQLRYQRSAVASAVSKKGRVVRRGDGVVCKAQDTALEGKLLKGSLFGGWKPKSEILLLVDMRQRKVHCKEHFEDEEQHLPPLLEDIGLSEGRQGSSVWK